MSEQYDYERRLNELDQGIDITFKKILEPFIYDNISDYLQNKDKKVDIMDVGCGCGYLSNSISKRFKSIKVKGIDISESAIKCAESHFHLNFNKKDIIQLEEDKKYDVIVYNMVLHNLRELEKAISKTSSILKDNGVVLITIPHPAFWLTDKITRGIITLENAFNYNTEQFYQIPFKIKNGNYHQTELTYYHRRLSTYINIFSKFLSLSKLEEVDFKNGLPTMLRIVLENKNNDIKTYKKI